MTTRPCCWIAPERRCRRRRSRRSTRTSRAAAGSSRCSSRASTGGLEELLARWGIEPADGVVVDPGVGDASRAARRACDPLVYDYATHPIDAGPRPTRMTFFRGARLVRACASPTSGDELAARGAREPALVARRRTSARSAAARAPVRRPEAAGRTTTRCWSPARYPRAGGERASSRSATSDFASNHDLRALYNLDLAVNAVHWAAAREPEITLRPKVASRPISSRSAPEHASRRSRASGCCSRSCSDRRRPRLGSREPRSA